MRISNNWLKEYVDIDVSIEELSNKMLLAGIETESIFKLSNSTNLVVGHVLEKEPHPDSDHLSVCKVNIGSSIEQIVCGAPNVDKNQKVIVAKVGATLPIGLTIEKRTVRGVESNGMICSLEELGIENKYIENKDGIHILSDDAVVGVDALEYLHFNDTVIDYSITANRGDLLSIQGMAYEVCAILNKKIKEDEFNINHIDEKINIDISTNTDKCSCYLSKVVKDVVIKESPNFIKSRLIASGIRPINNVVDISNYVMLEYGQPLHFFDFDKIGNKIIIRESKDNEYFTTLDGMYRTLNKGDILITNESETLAIAGVMGGLSSEVKNETKNILIESAVFDSLSVRKTSKNVYRSESSIRFEKGINPLNTEKALNKACYLLQKYASGKVIKETFGFNNNDLKDKVITLSKDKVYKVLGMEVSTEKIKEIFDRLDFKFEENNNIFKVSVPKRRLDINIEEDLIEEIARINGYENMQGMLPITETKEGSYNSTYKYIRKIHNKLRSLGLNEIMSYSLQSDIDFKKYNKDNYQMIRLAQPLSDDKSTLRYSLIPSMLKTIEYNTYRNIKNLHFYEIGKGYYFEEDYKEENKLCIGLTGEYLSNDWEKINIKSNFYLLKGILENLLNYLGFSNRYKLITDDIPLEFHPGKAAKILIDNVFIGYIGQVNPNTTKEEIFILELSIDKLMSLKVRNIKYKETSKYPHIEKDVSFVFDKSVKSEDVINTIKKTNKTISNVKVFDLYKGETIEFDKVSLGFNITFMDQNRTLTDEEVNGYFNSLIQEVLNTYKDSILRNK